MGRPVRNKDLALNIVKLWAKALLESEGDVAESEGDIVIRIICDQARKMHEGCPMAIILWALSIRIMTVNEDVMAAKEMRIIAARFETLIADEDELGLMESFMNLKLSLKQPSKTRLDASFENGQQSCTHAKQRRVSAIQLNMDCP